MPVIKDKNGKQINKLHRIKRRKDLTPPADMVAMAEMINEANGEKIFTCIVVELVDFGGELSTRICRIEDANDELMEGVVTQGDVPDILQQVHESEITIGDN